MNDQVLAQIETSHVREEWERLQELNRTLERALELAAVSFREGVERSALRALPGRVPLRVAPAREWTDYWIGRAADELARGRAA